MHSPTRKSNERDKAMLSNLQPLQKVDFELTYDGGNYMITKIK